MLHCIHENNTDHRGGADAVRHPYRVRQVRYAKRGTTECAGSGYQLVESQDCQHLRHAGIASQRRSNRAVKWGIYPIDLVRRWVHGNVLSKEIKEHEERWEIRLSNAILLLTCELKELREDKQTAVLFRIAQLEDKIMAAYENLKAILGEINGTTNEIADDVDEVIAKLSNPGGLTEAQAQEIIRDLGGASTKLKEVAAKYPVPTPPAEPPA